MIYSRCRCYLTLACIILYLCDQLIDEWGTDHGSTTQPMSHSTTQIRLPRAATSNSRTVLVCKFVQCHGESVLHVRPTLKTQQSVRNEWNIAPRSWASLVQVWALERIDCCVNSPNAVRPRRSGDEASTYRISPLCYARYESRNLNSQGVGFGTKSSRGRRTLSQMTWNKSSGRDAKMARAGLEALPFLSSTLAGIFSNVAVAMAETLPRDAPEMGARLDAPAAASFGAVVVAFAFLQVRNMEHEALGSKYCTSMCVY